MAIDLFGEVPMKPRAPRVLRMHVVDAGDSDDDEAPVIAKFECARCGSRTDWTKVGSVAEAKRGLPCPTCNAPADGTFQEKGANRERLQN